ncbi:MAG: pyrimidine-nucleoside phosphorylase [Clostridiaceae bacterium]
MRIVDIIEKKRDGRELSFEEINYFIKNYCAGEIYDYQASALLMAMFIKGLNSRETADLTESMASSGDRIDLSEIPGIKVDKHSTGGVGDKTTLVITPIAAACGVPVAKMSGRGLGHTGGTIDKLESIKGLRTALDSSEFIKNVKEIGIAVAGQTGNLAPADKKLYALRDVTGTISSIPLIASSIMSKKIASGADKILLDVKTGSGAFMKSLDDSIKLAKEMVSIGNHVGRKTVAIITDMDKPLGNAIGNTLEVKEAIETLRGKGPKDLEAVCLELAARMLELAGLGTIEKCREMAAGRIKDGSALKKLGEMAIRQGAEYVPWDSRALKQAAVVEAVVSPFDGYISAVYSDMVGKASMLLGAGRETKESSIDYSAGIILHKKTGEAVKKGDILAEFHTSSKDKLDGAEKVFFDACVPSDTAPVTRPLILAYID